MLRKAGQSAGMTKKCIKVALRSDVHGQKRIKQALGATLSRRGEKNFIKVGHRSYSQHKRSNISSKQALRAIFSINVQRIGLCKRSWQTWPKNRQNRHPGRGISRHGQKFFKISHRSDESAVRDELGVEYGIRRRVVCSYTPQTPSDAHSLLYL